MRLEIAINLFINEKETFTSERTAEHYRENLSYFEKFIYEYYDSNIEIEDIKIGYYNAYVSSLRKRNKINHFATKNSTPQKLTKRTIKTYTVALKTFFKWLYDNEYLEKDISLKMKIIKQEKPIKIPLYKDEVERIDKAYNPKSMLGLRNIIAMHLMLDCGMRVSEVVGLQIGWISFKNKYIHINKGKGGKDRIVPLPPKLKSMLYKYIYCYRLYCSHDYALQSKDGTPLTYDGFKNVVRRLRKKADVPRVTSHLCRHTFATSYIYYGGDVASLRILMGHDDIKTTDKYLHLANTYKLMGNDNFYKLDDIYYKRLS